MASGKMAGSERTWRWVWLGFAGYFAIAETVAIKSGDPYAPLSHHLRAILGIRKKPMYKYAGQVALGSTLIWLVAHLYKEIVDDSS